MQVLNRYELDPLIFQEMEASGSSFMELGIVCVALSDASFRLWDAFLCLAVSLELSPIKHIALRILLSGVISMFRTQGGQESSCDYLLQIRRSTLRVSCLYRQSL